MLLKLGYYCAMHIIKIALAVFHAHIQYNSLAISGYISSEPEGWKLHYLNEGYYNENISAID